MVSWLLRVVFGEYLMSDLGRACLLGIVCNSRWWARYRNICIKHDLKDLVNLICFGHVSVHGLDRLGMNVNEKQMEKACASKIMYVGCITWMNSCGNSDRAHEYLSKKQCHRNEKYIDGSVGAMVRMMVRGGCLTVRGSTRISWKYDDTRCVCGDLESEKHVLLGCNLYVDVR